MRNVERTTIAPTGTISMLYEVGSGIEPFFAIAYQKHIRGGDILYYFNSIFEKIAKERGFYSEELKKKIVDNHGSVQGISEVPEDIQRAFRNAHDVSYEWHVKMQAAFQRNVDNAVSKTINMRHDATIEDVGKAYIMAWQEGCKGITVYRDGSKDVQVLVAGKEKSDGILKRGDLEKVPQIASGLRIRQDTPFGRLHVKITHDQRVTKPLEIFAQLGKEGNIASADLEAICRFGSSLLRAGVPIDYLHEQLAGIGSSLSIASKDGRVMSLADGLAKAIEKYQVIRDLGVIKRVLIGEIDEEELERSILEYMGNGRERQNNRGLSSSSQEERFGVKCPECSSSLSFEEGCMKCPSCGFSQC